MQISKNERAILLAGLVIIGTMVLFPPWQRIIHYGDIHSERPVGYYFIGNPPSLNISVIEGVRIDIPRISLQLISALAVIGIAILLVRK